MCLFCCFCAAHLCLNCIPPSLMCDSSPPRSLDHNSHQRSAQRTNPVWQSNTSSVTSTTSLILYNLAIGLKPVYTCMSGAYLKKRKAKLHKCAKRWSATAERRRPVRESMVCTLNFTAMSVCDEKRSSYILELLSGQIGSIQDTQPPPR